MKRYLLFIPLTVIIIISMINCKGEDSGNNDGNNDHINNSVGKTFKFKNKLFSIPSPFHISDLILEISSSYNSDILNPAENKLNYSTTEKKALNLGIYIADMGYTNVYEQFSHTTGYIKVVRSLSSELQILNAFTEEILNEIEENQQNKDSLNRIFSEAYREADTYLSDNDRGEVAVLIMTGGWVEGLYIMTQVSKEQKNKMLLSRIGEQKYSLNNILKLLSHYNTDNSLDANEIYNKLSDLQNSFEKVKITYTYDKHIVLPNEKKTVILSNTDIEIEDKTLKEITYKIQKIRDIIVK